RYLNELPEFQKQNPTAELIAKVVFEKMRLLLGEIVYKVTIWESPTSSACYWEEA
ncbi:MAG: 6-carboxytetrahydropterin synthase, partial [Armatimonadetes bacterium]|nr:6-carboxytetrahydropterin synthase [Armatimonadota bacterium]